MQIKGRTNGMNMHERECLAPTLIHHNTTFVRSLILDTVMGLLG